MSQKFVLLTGARIPDQDWGPELVIVPMTLDDMQELLRRDQMVRTFAADPRSPDCVEWSASSAVWMNGVWPEEDPAALAYEALDEQLSDGEFVLLAEDDFKKTYPTLAKGILGTDDKMIRTISDRVGIERGGLVEWSAFLKHGPHQMFSSVLQVSDLKEEFEKKIGHQIVAGYQGGGTQELFEMAVSALRDLYMGYPPSEIVSMRGQGLDNLLVECVEALRGRGVDDDGGWDCDVTEGIRVAGKEESSIPSI